jgi:hypothetical protein
MANGFLPLEGVRVVNMTSSPAGLYCTEILRPLVQARLDSLGWIVVELAALVAVGVIRRVESSA